MGVSFYIAKTESGDDTPSVDSPVADDDVSDDDVPDDDVANNDDNYDVNYDVEFSICYSSFHNFRDYTASMVLLFFEDKLNEFYVKNPEYAERLVKLRSQYPDWMLTTRNIMSPTDKTFEAELEYKRKCRKHNEMLEKYHMGLKIIDDDYSGQHSKICNIIEKLRPCSDDNILSNSEVMGEYDLEGIYLLIDHSDSNGQYDVAVGKLILKSLLVLDEMINKKYNTVNFPALCEAVNFRRERDYKKYGVPDDVLWYFNDVIQFKHYRDRFVNIFQRSVDVNRPVKLG
jgi:hypothetical protein